MSSKNIIVRVSIDRRNPKFPKLYKKHKEEDKRCIPTLVELANNLQCQQLVVEKAEEEYTHPLWGAADEKACIYKRLRDYDFDKALIVDNDVECLDTSYNVFELPSFSAFGQGSYDVCFDNKPVGVNGGFLVISKEHSDAFASVDIDYSYFEKCKSVYPEIWGIDEFHVANCLFALGIKLNYLPFSVQKFPIHGDLDSKFCHWVSNTLTE